MQSQFDHLVETYFSGFDFDLGERELGYALSCDYDLEMFSASVGLIKTAITGIMKEDGTVLTVVFFTVELTPLCDQTKRLIWIASTRKSSSSRHCRSS